MRFCPLLFISSVLLVSLTACPDTGGSLSVQASGGTYARQTNPGLTDVTLGTAIVVKLRTASGALTNAPVNITITGPSGWNADRPSSFTYPAQAYWVVAPERAAPPIAGNYTVQANSNGQAISSNFAIADASQKLELATITATVQGTAPNQNVEASWSAITNAIGYYARVLNGTTLVPASDDVYTLEAKAKMPVGTLQSDAAYFTVVYAINFDSVAENPSLPTQFNLSDSLAAVPVATPLTRKITESLIERSVILVRTR
jgi:hypothetical protein